MKTKNVKHSLRALQLAYLQFTLKQEENEEVCMYCWRSGCQCSTDTVKNDPFLNLTTESEFTLTQENIGKMA